MKEEEEHTVVDLKDLRGIIWILFWTDYKKKYTRLENSTEISTSVESHTEVLRGEIYLQFALK